VRRSERNNSADTKVSEEGGGKRCSRCWSTESSLEARDEDHSEAGCSPAVHGRSMVEQRSICSPWKGHHARAGGCPEEAVTPWGAPCWSRLLAGPVDPWREELMPKQVCWQGL